MSLTDEQVAHITWVAHLALCDVTGEQMPPESAKAGHVLGVRFRRDNPEAHERDQHEAWRKAKIADGYVHGDVTDHNASPPTHADLVPWVGLPEHRRLLTRQFIGIVDAHS